MTADTPQGWYLLGPMDAVCSRRTCAPTHDAAMKAVEGVLRAWPLSDDELSRLGDVACIKCGRPLLRENHEDDVTAGV